MKRPGAATESALLTLAVIVLVGVLLSVLSVRPNGLASTEALQQSGIGGAAPADGAVTSGSATVPSGTSAGTAATRTGTSTVTGARTGATGATTTTRIGATGAGPVSAACAAHSNGGATDVGVTADSIKFAATVVDDGPGASFLGPVRTAMTAVQNQVNRAGGICGRQLTLELRNDSWNGPRGCQFLQNFVESEHVFGLAVVPSSEGLLACDSYIAQRGVPVVGSDGMLSHQYHNPWIWPVATSTVSTMHVMAKDAYDRGARSFGIVFDAKYHFGVEGAFAFDKAVKRLTGKDIEGFDPSLKSCTAKFCGIQPDQSDYSALATQFRGACSGKCDFVGYLLEPDTALSWFRAQGGAIAGIQGIGGAQPLFTRAFGESCKSFCDGMRVWTGYTPPEGQFAGKGAATAFVSTVRQQSSNVDVDNQFLEGGYIGMRLLVGALQRLGPNVTRAGLKAVLDGMNFDSGLSAPLAWRAGKHYANSSSMAWQIQYNQSFNGWRQMTGFVADPWVGQDANASGG